MKVSELIAAFEEKFAATKAERSQLIAEGRKKDADNIKSPFWLDEVIVPLAESISNRKGKKPYILGPCGLGSKVSITFTAPSTRMAADWQTSPTRNHSRSSRASRPLRAAPSRCISAMKPARWTPPTRKALSVLITG